MCVVLHLLVTGTYMVMATRNRPKCLLTSERNGSLVNDSHNAPTGLRPASKHQMRFHMSASTSSALASKHKDLFLIRYIYHLPHIQSSDDIASRGSYAYANLSIILNL